MKPLEAFLFYSGVSITALMWFLLYALTAGLKIKTTLFLLEFIAAILVVVASALALYVVYLRLVDLRKKEQP